VSWAPIGVRHLLSRRAAGVIGNAKVVVRAVVKTRILQDNAKMLCSGEGKSALSAESRVSALL